MLRPLPDLPPRVIGFEAVGEVHADDYRDVLRPALDQAAVNGEIRLVYVLGDDFSGYSAGADWEDAKLAFQHVRAWERTAVVTDVDWVEHAVRAFGWMAPGEVKVFPLSERDEAVRWVADLGPAFAGLVPQHDEIVPVDAHGVAEASTDAGSEPLEPSPADGTATDESPWSVAEPSSGGWAGPSDEPPRAELESETGPTPPTPVVVGADETQMMPASDLTSARDVTGPHPSVPASASPSRAEAATPQVPEQWAPDPTGRHQYRWWNGSEWTEHVADHGRNGVDPLG